MTLCPDSKRTLIFLGRGLQSDSQRGGGLLGDEILIGVDSDTPLPHANVLEAGVYVTFIP